ncbi:N2,N2-dimethylguanosine tRNA methyltransferase [Hamiltosporidium tvaerminnensis]|uniref:tRNA (guanine(26)-N(2))-dimethyltransferase n=2 Tax=Hamiltosporidium TaxID=1176354 RepID=A0A4Q9L0P7_9MICR|nr:RNA methyltransferase tRNA(m5U54)methyltransferase [Hamiltosporidium tvaerminnensis]TBU00904.1 N2,N2-dimethylguanosine tRNA methyltransferase [Hamiltosporidium tvaerminnensis]TBU06809.1 N2,N2-dimethylguanosine tRNA methyltransferase [Hamiltosporidium magnivora]TBU19977.1 N2,N2-dimethylguanosine tRNA methyltransferase [Hamiltosporidium tvaerminnensis]
MVDAATVFAKNLDEEYIEENTVRIQKHSNVFYNPAQSFNRDISIEVIKNFTKNIESPKIFEAMSATGLRGLRYAKELKNDSKIYMCDIDRNAINSIQENINFNKIDLNKIELIEGDCRKIMISKPDYFDVVDIDPFGSCTPFIESAIISIKNNGLLCLTSTDIAIISNNPLKCYMKYNTVTYKTPAFHELALRTLLSVANRIASKHSITIEPLLSVSVDFYIRIFLRIKKSNHKTRENILKISNYFLCHCFNYLEVPLFNKSDKFRSKKVPNNICNICGSVFNLAGPYWNSNLHDKIFVDEMLKKINENSLNEKRMIGFLRFISQEIDTFLYYSIPAISSYIKTSCVPLSKIISALFNLNYEVSLTHCSLKSIKTNAPLDIIYNIFLKYFNINRDYINLINTLEISFEENKKTNELITKNYYKKLFYSNLGPLSKPKN